MALNYTYEDFQSYLPGAGLTEADFSPEDLALAKKDPASGVALLEAKSDYKNAKTDEERGFANAKAEATRAKAGYSGGVDGVNGNASLTPDDIPGVQSSAVPNAPMAPSTTPYTPYAPPTFTAPYDVSGQTPGSFQSDPTPDPFAYEKQAPVYQPTPDYNNKYAGQQKQALDNVTNYGPFEFDAETNPQMQAYTKQYRREGNRAMQDTLGSLSAATGGRPSTAAMSAASQANDYYMSQLGDKLPEVYRSEFDKYMQEFGMAQNKLGAINTQEGIDYSRYWDGKTFDFDKFLADQNQYNTERGQALNEYQTGLGQFNEDRNFKYGQQYDDLNYKTGENNTAYDRVINADNQGYLRANDEKNFNYTAGRDAKNDALAEQDRKTQAENDAWDKTYKMDVLNDSREATLHNKMVDKFELLTVADQEIADYFDIEVGDRFGGEGSLLAIEQKKKDLELTDAQILKTQEETKHVGDTTSSGTPRASDAAIIAAHERVANGTGSAADERLLLENEFTMDYVTNLKDSTNPLPSEDEVYQATANLDDPKVGSMKDIEVILAAHPEMLDELKAAYPYIWDPSLMELGTIQPTN